MATRIEGATLQHQTCHEWALAKSTAAGGKYEHQLTEDSLYDVYANDVNERGIDSPAVEPNDLLVYSLMLYHCTYVSETRSNGSDGNEPSAIQWKWLGSGIYEYTTPEDANEFATPMCVGPSGFGKDEMINKPVENQGWVEDANYCYSPRVYGPD